MIHGHPKLLAIPGGKDLLWAAANDVNFHARVRYHWRKVQSDPGDLAGDNAALLGIAIATASVGIRPGWIPEVQRLGMAVAGILEPLFP